MWFWVVLTSLQCIYATLFKLKDLELGPIASSNNAACAGELTDSEASYVGGSGGTGEAHHGNSVVQMIVLPNYKEDEAMLAESMRSLSEAATSKSFWIVLAMEAREGEEGKQKAERLKLRFESSFSRIIIASHPGDLIERHQDGSENEEVPGKASNLKYAVDQGYKECGELGIHQDCVLLTIADADCLFHPCYFSHVGEEFRELRDKDQHQYTMWQAPQFSFRNYYTSPIVSRVWSYIASAYEFGGLASTSWGGHHMLFSCYTLPLLLAHNAEAWDGDVIAEDHHCYLKCFYYWLHKTANQGPEDGPIDQQPALTIRPVYLPVKSTAVANEVYWKSWTERWFQAKRHAQGVAELSYALLATYDACRTCLGPKRIFNWRLCCRMFQVVARIWCTHVLPICQGFCLAVLTVKWIWHRRHLSQCPDRLWLFANLNPYMEERFVICGLAGAWVLTWPIVVPWLLTVLANVLIMQKAFLKPAALNRYASIWHSEDAQVPQDRAIWKAALLIIFDCIFGMSWILMPYGLVVELIAYVNVLLYGNSFEYVTASKGCPSRKHSKLSSNYGTIGKVPVSFAKEAPKKEPITIA